MTICIINWALSIALKRPRKILFIFFQSQVLAKDWKPNLVGSFLSSKIARSITDIDNAAYYAQYSYNQNTESSGLGIIAIEALLANGQVKEAIPIGIKYLKMYQR